MQVSIIFQQAETKEKTISFEQAKLMQEITLLEIKYEKDKETARYLSGKKKGSWGRITMADIKRSEKLTQISDKIRYRKYLLSNLKN